MYWDLIAENKGSQSDSSSGPSSSPSSDLDPSSYPPDPPNKNFTPAQFATMGAARGAALYASFKAAAARGVQLRFLQVRRRRRRRRERETEPQRNEPPPPRGRMYEYVV